MADMALSGPGPSAASDRALARLETCERFGLVRSAVLHADLAAIHLRRGDLAEAEPHLRRVLEERPNDHDARLTLARSLMGQGRAQEAGFELAPLIGVQTAYEGDRDRYAQIRASAHALNGDIQGASGNRARAVAEYQAAIGEKPDAAEPRVALAATLADEGKLPEAIEQLETAIRLQPRHAPAHYNLAVVLAASGKKAEAIAHYRTSIELDPHDADARNNLGYLLSEIGELDAAAEQFRRAIEIRHDFAHPHFNLARILEARGKTADAAREREIAARLDPQYR
jgi:tetratricopeptide (TPR) repeat protein